MLAAWAFPAIAEPVRVATFNTGLSRDGPGLLLRDIHRRDPQVLAVAQVIAAAGPDVILLQDVDYDARLTTAKALRNRIAEAGQDFPHIFAFAPNTGVPTGVDLNGDGRSFGPEDAVGYGKYAGQGGMVLLSRLPVIGATDLSAQIWSDWAGADPVAISAAWGNAAGTLPIASVGQWLVSLALPSGQHLTLLAFHATPPVFDGPEDRNGLRNQDQLLFLSELAQGIKGHFVVLGDANNDPKNGEGRKHAINALLAHRRLQDPLPDTVTADWSELGLGWMRVDYVLPSGTLQVVGAGQHSGPIAEQASRHRLTWVDIELP